MPFPRRTKKPRAASLSLSVWLRRLHGLPVAVDGVGADLDDVVAHQCKLTAEQVEEIYLRTYKGTHEDESKAQNLALWRREHANVDFLRAPPIEPLGSPAAGWEVQSLDTRRFYPVFWRAVECRAVPPAKNKGELFKHSMKMLESAAVPLTLLLSRYEKVQCGHAMIVDASLHAITLLVESQAKQDAMELESIEGDITAEKLFQDPEVKAEAHRLRERWQSYNYDLDLLRAITMGIFKIRGDHHPPAILVYSIPDEDYLTVVCRDVLITSDRFHRELPVLRLRPFLTWPLRDHHSTEDKELPFQARGKERLEFELGMEFALANKTAGTEALTAKDYELARYKYSLAGTLCARITEDISEEQTGAVVQMRVALGLNTCMCALKQEEWAEAVKLATQVLELQPDNGKALYRRAQAFDAKEEWADAEADLIQASAAMPDDTAIPKLLAKVRKGQTQQERKAKQAFGKMFS